MIDKKVLYDDSLDYDFSVYVNNFSIFLNLIDVSIAGLRLLLLSYDGPQIIYLNSHYYKPKQ
jgi:hypothetical protein